MVRLCALCVLAAVLGAVASKVTDRRGPLNLSFSKMAVYDEELCQREGGMCLEEGDCPEGKLATERGLCPEQQKRGIECCFGVSRTIKDCQGLGGHCTSNACPSNLQLDANDCNGKEACCALVV